MVSKFGYFLRVCLFNLYIGVVLPFTIVGGLSVYHNRCFFKSLIGSIKRSYTFRKSIVLGPSFFTDILFGFSLLSCIKYGCTCFTEIRKTKRMARNMPLHQPGAAWHYRHIVKITNKPLYVHTPIVNIYCIIRL
jgi:hypothetical protein